MYQRFIFIAFTCFILFGCIQKRIVTSQQNELVFSVDEKLLGDAIQDSSLQITFAPPKNWIRISDSVLRIAQDQAFAHTDKEQSSDSIMIGKYGFRDAVSNSVIVISQLASFDTTDTSKDLESYKKLAQKKDSSASINTSFFFSHGLKVHQLMDTDVHSVSFKMVFSHKSLAHVIQFDFIVPMAAYKSLVKTIESVAGSVYLIHSIS